MNVAAAFAKFLYLLFLQQQQLQRHTSINKYKVIYKLFIKFYVATITLILNSRRREIKSATGDCTMPK